MKGAPTQREPGIVKAMSLLFLFRCFLGLAFIISAAWAIYQPSPTLLVVTGGIFLFMLILFGVQVAESGSCRCAVCTTPLFKSTQSQSGNVSPRAKSLIGSRRIYRSLSITLGGYYHCNHCGEKISCKPIAPEPAQIARIPQATRITTLPSRRAS